MVKVKKINLSFSKKSLGYIQVTWNVEKPGVHDYVAIYKNTNQIKVGKKDPGGYIKYYKVNGKSDCSITSHVKYISDEQYYAIYVSYENKEYIVKKISEKIKNPEHALSLLSKTDGKKNIVLKWTNADTVGYWDYIALFDFRPELGSKDAKKYLSRQWQWARKASHGSYETSTPDNLESLYYIGYCVYKKDKTYSIKNIASIIEEYKLTNLKYIIDNPKITTKNCESATYTLRNENDNKTEMTCSISKAFTSTKTWSMTHGWNFGIKNTIEGAIPFFAKDKLEISFNYSGSITESGITAEQISLNLAVKVNVDPNMQVTATATAKSFNSSPIKYTADRFVKYRNAVWEKKPQKIEGDLHGSFGVAVNVHVSKQIPITSSEDSLTKSLLVTNYTAEKLRAGNLQGAPQDEVTLQPDTSTNFYYNPIERRWKQDINAPAPELKITSSTKYN